MKPGIISNIAPNAIDAPDIISYIGIYFLYKLLMPDLKVLILQVLQKYMPIIAVKKI